MKNYQQLITRPIFNPASTHIEGKHLQIFSFFFTHKINMFCKDEMIDGIYIIYLINQRLVFVMGSVKPSQVIFLK